MPQHRDAGAGGSLREGLEMPLVAAVVDDDDIVKPLGQQAVHDLNELFVRLVGGDDSGDFHFVFYPAFIREFRSC